MAAEEANTAPEDDQDDVISLSDSEIWMGEMVPGPGADLGEDSQVPFDMMVKEEQASSARPFDKSK